MEFRILGPVEAVADDARLQVRGRALTLLALLLLERGGVVSPDRAIDALWGSGPPADPRNALQVVVSRLRAAIGEEHIEHRAGGYAVVLAPGALDAVRFEELLERGRAEARTGEHDRAADSLRAALSLWRGPALADMRDADFAQPEIARLEELRLEGLETRIHADLALGAGVELVGELRALVASNPLRERLRAALMLALARAGRQPDALEAYREARVQLRDGLGLDPSPELRDLQRAILRHATPSGQPARTPAGRTLPLPSTPLVGRTAELAEATSLLLRAGRVLTLCGPGGTGKTRLALHVADGVSSAFPDGVVAVDLAPLRGSAEVAGAVARAVAGGGAPPLGDPLEAIGVRASSRRLLVLLDNAEHVLDATAGVVDALLAVEGPRVLVTSRERLGVEHETVYDVPSLTPADGVALFTACARRVDPSFAPDGATALLCARLDWLPLALELAAARTTLLGPQQLLERLEERLDLLDAGPRADQRQRTLRATTDWSVGQLGDDELRLFKQLSVFADDVPWEAIEEVCSPGLAALTALVERSLVRRRLGSDGRPRFGMLETIRQYAAELLSQDPVELGACRRRHAHETLARARRLNAAAGSALELEALRPELLLALGTARELPDPDLELDLVAAMHTLWRLRGPYADGVSALERALARAAPGERRGPALLALADLTTLHGDPATGAAVAAEALAAARAAKDRVTQARALNLLGNAAFGAGELTAAAASYEEAIALERPHGASGYLLAPLANLGHTLLELGDLETARATLEECLVASTALDDRRRASACLHSLGLLALHQGRVADAEEALRRGLEIARALGTVKYQIDILGVLGATRIERGDIAAGVRLLACADVQAAALGLTPDVEGSVGMRVREGALRAALDALGPGAFDAEYAAGRELALEAAGAVSAGGRA